jgi:hypothetical protein
MSVSLLDSYSFSHQLTITLQDGNTPRPKLQQQFAGAASAMFLTMMLLL